MNQLKTEKAVFSNHRWTKLTVGKLDKVERFADEELKQLLDEQAQQYLDCIDAKIEEELNQDNSKKERICREYEEFIEKTEQSVKDQNENAQRLRDERYVELCRKYENASSEKEYKDLKGEFRRMHGYKESNEKADECNSRIKEINEKAEEEERRLAQERRDSIEKKNKRSKMIWRCIALVVLVAVVFVIVKNIGEEKQYEAEQKAKVESADKLLNDGEYMSAIDAYSSLENYDKKDEKIDECINKANDHIDELLKNGKNEEALKAYYGYKRNAKYAESLKYKEHSEAIDICDAITELKTINDGQLHNLAKLYKTLKDNSDNYSLDEYNDYDVIAFMLSLNGEWKCVTSRDNSNNTDYLTGSFLDDDWFSIEDGVIKQPKGDNDYYYWEIEYKDGDYYELYLNDAYDDECIDYKMIKKVNDECINIHEEYESGDTKTSVTWTYKRK